MKIYFGGHQNIQESSLARKQVLLMMFLAFPNTAMAPHHICRSSHDLDHWSNEFGLHFWILKKSMGPLMAMLLICSSSDALFQAQYFWNLFFIFINANWKRSQVLLAAEHRHKTEFSQLIASGSFGRSVKRRHWRENLRLLIYHAAFRSTC